MVMLWVAGCGAIAAGLAAIIYGIPVSGFSFGNTLILAGTIGCSTGLLLFGMAMIVRELRNGALVREFSDEQADDDQQVASSPELRKAAAPASRDKTGADADASALPWAQEARRLREREAAKPVEPEPEAEPEVPAPPPPPPEPVRRNLLFATSRRERADSKAADKPADDLPRRPSSVLKETRVTTFDDEWPAKDALKKAPVVSPPAAAAPELKPAPAPTPAPVADVEDDDEPQQAPALPERDADVTVLKSGIVDGMAYSLFSDGSIEAELPEGIMRFSSIDELRQHLDQRG